MDDAKKFDAGKPMWTYAPLEAFEECVKVMTFGAEKYEPRNYLKNGGLAEDRTLSAAYRHLIQHIKGEYVDKETGISHLAHCAAEILMALEIRIQNDKEKMRWAK